MLTRVSLRATALSMLIALPALAHDHETAGIEVHDAYAISSGAQAISGAAFMVIHNHGGPDDRLIGVASPAAERVELHTHEEDADGVMRMMHVEEGFDLPADGEIVMERGGHHVMFLGLTAPFEDGSLVPVTLIFETAGEVTIEVPVDPDRMTGHAHGHHHHGDDHGDDHGHDHGHHHGHGD